MHVSIDHHCIVNAGRQTFNFMINKAAGWILGMVMVAMVSEPALPQTASTSSSSSTEQSIGINDRGVQRWRTTTLTSDFNIELRGKIELTDDDKDIKTMSDDGYLEINKTVFGSKRTIVIEPLGGGKLKREYYEGRTKMDWETAGKAWLGEILPELVRSSTIGAEGRVNRIFAKGGAPAVLAEISELSGDYTKAHYGKLLLAKNIPSGELPKVISKLADEIDSDYYLSTLLKDSMDKLLVTTESSDAFFKATENVNSDYYRSVILKEALKKFSASPTQVKSILKSAQGISSDYYQSVVLSTLLEQDNVKDETLSDLIAGSAHIGSDYYRTQVLSAALKKSGISKTGIKNVLTSVADVESDYYKTNVFNDLAERTSMEPEMQIQLIALIKNSVGSDYYASTSLSKLLKNQKMSSESFKALMSAAGELGSSNYAADVLQQAADRTLSNDELISLLKASTSIDSEYYLTSVLQALAPQVKNADSSVKDAYRQAAKSIDSETYYGRALRAIE
jgi:hypothetical protein